VIAGDIQCDESLTLREAKDGSWHLVDVVVAFAAADEASIKRAREFFLSGIGVPSTAEESTIPGVAGPIGATPDESPSNSSEDWRYSWVEGGHRFVVRLIVGVRESTHTIWLSWERH
jgi:hypothetical protein